MARSWANAAPLAPYTNVYEDVHDYLEAKGIQPHGVRHIGSVILVPVRDADGRLQSLQTIGQDGSKQFMPDGRMAAAAS